MPIPADQILGRMILPTGLSSEEIRETIPADIRRRSFFSARTAEAEYLAFARQVCADVADGRIGVSEARFRLERFLERIGYEGTPGSDSGDITDIGSIARLDLIVKTQRDMAHSVALLDAQTPSTLAAFPAWRLVRFGTREKPRRWEERWNAAGESVGWNGVARNGEFIARKDSPIWDAIGAGAGGYRDTLGNPFPPFAFNSGMDWEPVSAEECDRIGLDVSDVSPKGQSLAPDKADIDRLKDKLGPDEMADLLGDIDEALANAAPKRVRNTGEDRKEDGRFAPKGTGDQTHGEEKKGYSDENRKKVGEEGTWQGLGLPSLRDLTPDEPVAKTTVSDARRRIAAGEKVKNPFGEELAVDERTFKHLAKKGRDPREIHKRLSELDFAEETVRNPHEIWKDPKSGRRKYVRYSKTPDGNQVINAVDEADHLFSWHSTGASLDHYRNGILLYIRP